MGPAEQQKGWYVSSEIRLQKTGQPLSPTPPPPTHSVMSTPQRGPHCKEMKPPANSQWGTKACQQPRQRAWKWIFQSHLNQVFRWSQSLPTAWPQSQERSCARSTQLNGLGSDPWETVWDNKYLLFEVLSFGIICYAAMDNQYKHAGRAPFPANNRWKW